MSAAPLAYYFFFTPNTAATLVAVGLLTGTPALDPAVISQAHSLAANGLTTGAVVLDQAGVNPGLNANGLTAGTPSLDTATLSQGHSLDGTSLVIGTPVLDSAPLEGQLVANGLTAAPQLGQGALSQSHGLNSSSLVSGTPALDSPGLSQDTPGAASLVTGSPVIGSPVITQQQTLAAAGLVLGVPTLDTAGQDIGIAFICAPDLTIEKELTDSAISPSADLRLKLTLTRVAEDINPANNQPTDYTDSLPSFAIFRCGGETAIATLTLDSGISRATNDADSQVYTALWAQASVSIESGKKLHYRFTVTTKDGALVSGDDSKPAYAGEFSVARY